MAQTTTGEKLMADSFTTQIEAQREATIEWEHEQFIGIFPNAVNADLCSDFVEWYNAISEHGLTMSSMKDSRKSGIIRKDELIHIPSGLPPQCFPEGLCKSLWKNISECFNIYINEYSITRPMSSYNFKIHRVQSSGGVS